MIQQATYNTLILGALLAENCLPQSFGLLLCKSLHYFLYRSKTYQPSFEFRSGIFVPDPHVESHVLEDGWLPNVTHLSGFKWTPSGEGLAKVLLLPTAWRAHQIARAERRTK